MPYILCSIIEHKKIIGKIDENIIISYRPRITLSYVYNNKTPTPYLNNSNLIYKINCRDCDRCYVGVACQYLARRISQHKYNVGREEKHIALAAHALDEGHTFDFENTKIRQL